MAPKKSKTMSNPSTHSTRSKLVGFNVRYHYDEPGPTETDEERYQRLKEKYKEKRKLFIDLDTILKDPCPPERLRRNLDDQDVEQIYKDEVVRLVTNTFRKHGIKQIVSYSALTSQVT
jgi:hypothetical protein